MGAKISIVIAAYNAETFLGRTLDSVLRQTFTDWELVVVDDGSSDNTAEIIATYVSSDSRINALSQANQGCSGARNAGVDASSSTPYIIFIDADDVWEPNALKSLYTHIEANPDHVGVFGCARFIGPDDELIRPGVLEAECRTHETYVNGKVICLDKSEPIAFNTLVVSCTIRTPGMLLLRREAVERVGRFDESLSNAEDWDFYIRLSRLGTLVYLDELVLNYRVHASNKSSRLSKLNAAVKAIRKKTIESPENTPEQRAVAIRCYPAVQQFFLGQKLKFTADYFKKKDWTNGARQLRYAAGHLLRFVRGRP